MKIEIVLLSNKISLSWHSYVIRICKLSSLEICFYGKATSRESSTFHCSFMLHVILWSNDSASVILNHRTCDAQKICNILRCLLLITVFSDTLHFWKKQRDWSKLGQLSNYISNIPVKKQFSSRALQFSCVMEFALTSFYSKTFIELHSHKSYFLPKPYSVLGQKMYTHSYHIHNSVFCCLIQYNYSHSILGETI